VTEFEVGDRVEIVQDPGSFTGKHATVSQVPGARGPDSTQVRVDGFDYGEGQEHDGHSYPNKDLTRLPDVDVKVVYQIETPRRSVAGGWTVYILYLEGGGTATDFKTLEDAEDAWTKMPLMYERRIVRRTVVTAERVEVVRSVD